MPNQAAEAADNVTPRTVFSVDQLAPKDRFAAWKESISCIFDIDADRDVRGADFFATVEAQMFGQAMLAQTSTVAQTWSRTASRVAQDDMDHFMIQLYLDGKMEIEDGATGQAASRDNLVVFDLSRESITRTGSFNNLSFIVPRALIEGRLMAPDDQHMRTIPRTEPLARLLQDHLVSLQQLGGQITADQATEVSSSTIALTAACLNGSGNTTPGGHKAISRAQLHNIKRLIEQHLHDPSLTSTKVAALAGISRTRLYELFEPLDGVASHIRERRLRRALAMLLNRDRSQEKIGAIALSCGFADEGTFSRAFRRRFGHAPRDASQTVMDREESQCGPNGLDRRYEKWLRGL